MSTRLCARWDALSAENSPAREKSLAPGSLVAKVVDKFERPSAKLEHREVCRRTDIERAAVAEHFEHTRRVDGRTGDHLIEGHAEIQELRHDVRKVDDLRGASLRRPVSGERIR